MTSKTDSEVCIDTVGPTGLREAGVFIGADEDVWDDGWLTLSPEEELEDDDEEEDPEDEEYDCEPVS